MYNFNALVSRIKYIPRWGLMRQSRPEYVAEHTTEVMQIAHTLAVIAKVKFNKNVDVQKIILSALYHDISEILTGDMPTPVKYKNEILKNAYHQMERTATTKLIDTLDPALAQEIAPCVLMDDLSDTERHIIKAADKLSALIKCMEETQSGNTEFRSALTATQQSLVDLKLEEVDYFMLHMLPAYHLCLDQLAQI